MNEDLKPRQMAFWHRPGTDNFPNWECGVIVKWHQDKVQTEGYGYGCHFTPAFILPEKEGKALQAKLDRLLVDYREAKATLQANFDQRSEDLASMGKSA